MLAKEFIAERVKKRFVKSSHLIAHIDSREWWHVHQDEEVPKDRRLTIKVICADFVD